MEPIGKWFGLLKGRLIRQNTWPALDWGDLDGDGRPEIYWGIVNYTRSSRQPPLPSRFQIQILIEY
jgi:hypothetical protein